MSTVKADPGTQTSITITLTSLASAASRQSAVVDNTSNLYVNAKVSLTYETASGTLGTNPAIYIYAYELADGGNYSDSATGSDASYTMPTGSTPRLIGIHAPTAAATQYTTPSYSIGLAGGSDMPAKWGIIVQNSTGLALSSSVAEASYLPINYSVA